MVIVMVTVMVIVFRESGNLGQVAKFFTEFLTNNYRSYSSSKFNIMIYINLGSVPAIHGV